MNKIQRLSFGIFALGLSSLLVMLMCETISQLLNIKGLCTLPIATTNMIGGIVFVITIVSFSVLLISVSLEIDERNEVREMKTIKIETSNITLELEECCE